MTLLSYYEITLFILVMFGLPLSYAFGWASSDPKRGAMADTIVDCWDALTAVEWVPGTFEDHALCPWWCGMQPEYFDHLAGEDSQIMTVAHRGHFSECVRQKALCIKVEAHD